VASLLASSTNVRGQRQLGIGTKYGDGIATKPAGLTLLGANGGGEWMVTPASF